MEAFASAFEPFLIRASQFARDEIITAGGRRVTRRLRRKEPIKDNDLPEITKRCHASGGTVRSQEHDRFTRRLRDSIHG